MCVSSSVARNSKGKVECEGGPGTLSHVFSSCDPGWWSSRRSCLAVPAAARHWHTASILEQPEASGRRIS